MGIRVLLKTFPPQQLRIVLHARLLTALTGTCSLFGRPKIGEIACLALNMCSQSSINSFFTPDFLVSLDFFLVLFVNELACLNNFCDLRKSELHEFITDELSFEKFPKSGFPLTGASVLV